MYVLMYNCCIFLDSNNRYELYLYQKTEFDEIFKDQKYNFGFFLVACPIFLYMGWFRNFKFKLLLGYVIVRTCRSYSTEENFCHLGFFVIIRALHTKMRTVDPKFLLFGWGSGRALIYAISSFMQNSYYNIRTIKIYVAIYKYYRSIQFNHGKRVGNWKKKKRRETITRTYMFT